MSEEKNILFQDVQQSFYGSLIESALLKKCFERTLELETGKPISKIKKS